MGVRAWHARLKLVTGRNVTIDESRSVNPLKREVLHTNRLRDNIADAQCETVAAFFWADLRGDPEASSAHRAATSCAGVQKFGSWESSWLGS